MRIWVASQSSQVNSSCIPAPAAENPIPDISAPPTSSSALKGKLSVLKLATEQRPWDLDSWTAYIREATALHRTTAAVAASASQGVERDELQKQVDGALELVRQAFEDVVKRFPGSVSIFVSLLLLLYCLRFEECIVA